MEKSVENNLIKVNVTVETVARNDLDAVIYDLDNEIKLLSSQADKWDYLVAVASGVLCGMLDILWVGDFSLEKGRAFASEQVDGLVIETAKILGFNGNDLKEAVRFLEERFPIPSDGNTPDFGGGLQHHIRDFGHHPTIIGLVFSILTQFTGMSYGTDENGVFKPVLVPDKSKKSIGKNIPDKLFKGTITWFFHLVSDMDGSSSTAEITGGTGIPGPILSLAKELSALPVFRNMKIGEYNLTTFISKIFNGTAYAKHDENGKIIKDTVIKFDLRGEIGGLEELGKQAIPVIANESIVRSFYFIRRLAIVLKKQDFESAGNIDWDGVKPFDNPTVDRMITISSAVFSTVDIAEAVLSKKYFVAVNYVGIGRFVVAIGDEIVNYLKVRDVKRIRQMYKDIRRNTFTETDNNIYKRIGEDMDLEKFGLTLDQTEILYNLELHKTINDFKCSNIKTELKKQWIREWKHYMEKGFSSFVGDEKAVLHWYSAKNLHKIIAANTPEKPWFRLVLLEAMLFEPYYTLSTETDKKGKVIPNKKYKELQLPLVGYDKSEGDKFLDSFFTEDFYHKNYIKRLRKCYVEVTRELNEVLKNAIMSISITAGIAIVAIATAGTFAGSIAVALVGSNFAGLSGAALTSACLAYLGGGAIAFGGLGMAGGTMVIVGGGAVLGLGVGAGVGGAVGAVGVLGKKDTILQSAKLMVSVREIFLNDEHDIEYSNTIYEQYVKNIADIEKELVELKLKESVVDKEEKASLKRRIKDTEKSVQAMKLAMKNMKKFNSSFALGESRS